MWQCPENYLFVAICARRRREKKKRTRKRLANLNQNFQKQGNFHAFRRKIQWNAVYHLVIWIGTWCKNTVAATIIQKCHNVKAYISCYCCALWKTENHQLISSMNGLRCFGIENEKKSRRITGEGKNLTSVCCHFVVTYEQGYKIKELTVNLLRNVWRNSNECTQL